MRPSSHHNPLLLTRADCDALSARHDPEVGCAPDAGHLLRGGQVMADTLTAFCSRQVHLKDVDPQGDLAMLGAGVR